MKNSSLRKLIIIISFMLAPITFIYISPVIIVLDAVSGIISGSFILYCTLFITSLITGRLFCSRLCPIGGAQECLAAAVSKPVKNSKPLHIIRHIIWILWLGLVLFIIVTNGGYSAVKPLNHSFRGLSLHTEGGNAYMIYFIILAALVVCTIVFGKRAGCHMICPMANFMIIGRKLGRLLRLPGFYLKTDAGKCSGCKKCVTVCQMSLDIEEIVKKNMSEGSNCILCGDCVKACPKEAVQIGFGVAGKKREAS